MQNLKLKVIFKYLRPYKKEFFFGAIALLLVNILSVVIPLEVKNIIDQLQEGFSSNFIVKKSIFLTSNGIKTLRILTNKSAKAPKRNSFLYGLRYLDITLNFKFFI